MGQSLTTKLKTRSLTRDEYLDAIRQAKTLCNQWDVDALYDAEEKECNDLADLLTRLARVATPTVGGFNDSVSPRVRNYLISTERLFR